MIKNNISLYWPSRLAAALLLVTISSGIFLIRLEGIISRGDLFDPVGCQGPPLYSIWKIRNGYPLYEWPDRGNYNVTFYNFLFYNIYSNIMIFICKNDLGLIVHCRLLSAAFAAAGAIATYRLVTILEPTARGPAKVLAGLLVFQIWFGTSPMGWWNVAIRPDMLALSFAVWGLLIYVVGVRQSRPVWWFALASVLFFCGWASKQSMVALLAAVTLHALVGVRRLWVVIGIAGPAAALMVACLLIGGEIYRRNVMWAPSISPILLECRKFVVFIKVIISNIWIWLYPIIFILLGRGRGIFLAFPLKRLSDNDGLRELGPIVTASVVGLAWGILTLLREGGEDNGLLEVHVSLGVLAIVLLIRETNNGHCSAAMRYIAPILILSSMTYPLGQLILRLEPMLVATCKQYYEKKIFANYLYTIDKPIFISDDMLSQPWISSSDRYPAVVLDVSWYDIADRRHLLHGEGIASLIRKKFFASLVLDRRFTKLSSIARQAGYSATPTPKGVVPCNYIVYACPRLGEESRDSTRAEDLSSSLELSARRGTRRRSGGGSAR
jgi:hypothetical protein